MCESAAHAEEFCERCGWTVTRLEKMRKAGGNRELVQKMLLQRAIGRPREGHLV